MAHSRSATRPQKPYPDFPLFPHATGRWAKKIRGQFHYFGSVQKDPKGEAALDLWLGQRDELLAGRTPRPPREELTIRDLANHFLTAKQTLLEAGDLAKRTFDEYHATAEAVLQAFGKNRYAVDLAADDFDALRVKLSKRLGPIRLGNEVQRIRGMFRYGYDAGLIAQPVRFGPNFRKPSQRVLRAARHAKGKRLFTPAQLKRILRNASTNMRAMIHLALNAGFGNTDCASLPIDVIQGKWLAFPRPKTAIMRRVPLWPETQAAIQKVLSERTTPKFDHDAGFVFVTKYGQRWSSETAIGSPISAEFKKLLVDLRIYRPGLSFYSLRHVFATVAGELRDHPATSAILGHAPRQDDMAAVYNEEVSDARLQAVVDHVRRWTFGPKVKATSKIGKAG